jgi:hypothetical protein
MMVVILYYGYASCLTNDLIDNDSNELLRKTWAGDTIVYRTQINTLNPKALITKTYYKQGISSAVVEKTISSYKTKNRTRKNSKQFYR